MGWIRPIHACSAFVVGLALVAAATGASAASVSGDIVELLNAPPSVVEEGTESDSQIFLFLERQNVSLASTLAVNVSSPGSYGANPGVTTLATGTVLDSYFLHMDIVDSGDGGVANRRDLAGSIVFDRPVLGIIGSDPELDASDAILGSPSTFYPTGTSGRDTWEGGDSITLSADRMTLTIHTFRVFNDYTDQIRILVLPEADTGALLGLGLVGLGWHRKRRRLR